jgi:hypothetical protein
MRYRIVDNRLEIVIEPPYSLERATKLLEAARRDPQLPPQFGLLVDTRAVNLDMSLADVLDRVGNLSRVFGSRLRAITTVNSNEEHTPPTHLKVSAAEQHLRAAIFHNLDVARLWLDGVLLGPDSNDED